MMFVLLQIMLRHDSCWLAILESWWKCGDHHRATCPRIRYVCKRILVYSGRWLLRIFWRALLACTDRLRMNWWPTMMMVMMRSPVTTDRSYQPWSSNLFSSDFRLVVLLSSSLKWSATDDLLAQPFSFGSHLCTFTVKSDLICWGAAQVEAQEHSITCGLMLKLFPIQVNLDRVHLCAYSKTITKLHTVCTIYHENTIFCHAHTINPFC